MLSMKRSTSWRFSSRKYSATLSAESATRARAPGGSFIWPKISDVRSITPDSFISPKSWVPSRVRSPTPQNTEYPPWTLAMLLMSSMMRTVLPTPAPPKSPILPPFMYGASRSITLIPVTRISSDVLSSENAGAGRWMG
jgi:hypothetical protein